MFDCFAPSLAPTSASKRSTARTPAATASRVMMKPQVGSFCFWLSYRTIWGACLLINRMVMCLTVRSYIMCALQLKFKDKIDNSPTPFVPKLKSKPVRPS